MGRWIKVDREIAARTDLSGDAKLVLSLLSDRPGLKPAEIRDKLGIPLSTTYRIIKTLSQDGNSQNENILKMRKRQPTKSLSKINASTDLPPSEPTVPQSGCGPAASADLFGHDVSRKVRPEAQVMGHFRKAFSAKYNGGSRYVDKPGDMKLLKNFADQLGVEPLQKAIDNYFEMEFFGEGVKSVMGLSKRINDCVTANETDDEPDPLAGGYHS